MKCPGRATQAPSRTPAGASGSDAGSSARSRLEPGRRQRLAANIGHDAGEIAHHAVGIDEAGLLHAGSAEADELHGVSSP